MPPIRIVARLRRSPDVEVRFCLIGDPDRDHAFELSTWVRAPDGSWWRSEGRPDLSFQEFDDLRWAMDRIFAAIERGEAIGPWTLEQEGAP